MDSNLETASKNRLIVLLPGSLAGSSDLAQKIHWMAVRERRSVLYLVLFDDPGEYSLITREMATMTAMTTSSMVVVNAKLVSADEWFPALQKTLLPGDILVCQAEQTVKTGLLHSTPLCEFLQNKLDTPIRVVSGYYKPFQVQANLWLHKLLVWTGFLAVIILFGLLEIRIDQDTQGLEHTLLLILALGFEFGAIWLINYFA